jgi:hypothetical protein
LSTERIPENARASDQDARASKNANCQALLAERTEVEIARIRAARPALESRLDRAGTLLVTQLSCSSPLRPIRARIAADGTCQFLVGSTSSPRTTYSVVPGTFECSCPDARRRGKGCKHSLACFILERAARTQQKGCGACNRGWVHRTVEVVNPATGEVAEAINTTRCTRCSDGLSYAFVQRWLEAQRWIFARSRASNPHWYCLRRDADSPKMFEKVVEHLREFGSPYVWWGSTYLQYVAGQFAYWTMGAGVENTQIINRKSLEQVRIDELRNTGGGGIQWGWLHGVVEVERAELRGLEAGQDELV